jgi:hypothetical protein
MVKTPAKSKKAKPRHIRMNAETGAIELRGVDVSGVEKQLLANAVAGALKRGLPIEDDRQRLQEAYADFEALYDQIQEVKKPRIKQAAMDAIFKACVVLSTALRVPQVSDDFAIEVKKEALKRSSKGGVESGRVRREKAEREWHGRALYLALQSRQEEKGLSLPDVADYIRAHWHDGLKAWKEKTGNLKTKNNPPSGKRLEGFVSKGIAKGKIPEKVA